MDQLHALGTAISDIVGPTHHIYSSLLQPQLATIKSTPRKTFQYGPHQRQNLDIYYPSPPEKVAKDSPIMMFLYGGGLVQGSKILPMIPNELVYANLGHFFAEKYGFVVVIPDYRLVPEAKFPSGADDVAAVIDWIHRNPEEVGRFGNYPRDLFLMGNSAGGVHISTYILSSLFNPSRAQILSQEPNLLRLKAVILVVSFSSRDGIKGGCTQFVLWQRKS
jgi:acetyl esterase/lipase